MSLTPELGKVTGSGGIRKSLLTPCRRVGLSRKTKTPSSLTKIENNSSSEVIASTTPDINITIHENNASLINNDTPVNHKNISRKRLASPDSSTKKSATRVQQNRKVSRLLKSKKCLIPEPTKHTLNSTSSSIEEHSVKEQLSDDDKSLESCGKFHQNTLSSVKPLNSDSVRTTHLKAKQENKENSNGNNSETVTLSANEGIASKCSDYVENLMENVLKKQRRKPKSNRKLLEETNEQNENNSSSCSLSKIKSLNEISQLSEDEDFVIKKSKKKMHCISSSSELSTNSNDFFCEKKAEVSINTNNDVNKSLAKCNENTISTSIKVEGNTEEVPRKFKKRILSMKKSTESASTNFDSDSEFLPVLTSTQKSFASLPVCTVSLEQLPMLYEECQIKTEDKDDADFVATSKTESVDCTEKIRSITKRIKQKEEQLESLKRAELYKKKHNIEDLQLLTSTWKQGCIQALSDLLPHLQSHGDINMQTLLKNLKIPSTMISCSTDGELI